jgi:hypothetical protein
MNLIDKRNRVALTIYGYPSSVKEKPVMSNIGNSTNILWHNCPIGQSDRQKLLGQKGCVVWITGLSGSGIFSVDCCLDLHAAGHSFLFHILGQVSMREFPALLSKKVSDAIVAISFQVNLIPFVTEGKNYSFTLDIQSQLICSRRFRVVSHLLFICYFLAI